jgi:hypothetical protein
VPGQLGFVLHKKGQIVLVCSVLWVFLQIINSSHFWIHWVHPQHLLVLKETKGSFSLCYNIDTKKYQQSSKSKIQVASSSSSSRVPIARYCLMVELV